MLVPIPRLLIQRMYTVYFNNATFFFTKTVVNYSKMDVQKGGNVMKVQ